MRRGLPLYARWAIGFVLHVGIFTGVLVALLAGRWREPIERLVFHQSQERIQRAIRLLMSELAALPPDEWDAAVQRFEDHYGVQLALLTTDGAPMAGSLNSWPAEITERLRRPPFVGGGDFRPPEPPAPDASPPRPREFRGGLPVWLERTGPPPRYWLISRVRIGGPHEAGIRALLVIRLESLFGGLLGDPRPLLLGALAVVLLSMLLWLPFVRGITRSVEAMTQAGRRIAEGRLDTRVAVRRRDELGELARTLNEMAARLEGLIADQKRFLGGVAHELCAPLARLQMALGILEQRVGPAEREYLDAAQTTAREMSEMVNELLSFSKAAFGQSVLNSRAVPVAAAARAAAKREAPGRNVRIEAPGDLAAWADPALLDRALGNLLRNSARYAGDGPITVRAAPAGDAVEIVVEDEGPGVPPEALPRLFEPFYRVESSRDREAGGQGLGLTLVKAAVESMGGSATAELRRPHGLAVRLRLPARAPHGTENAERKTEKTTALKAESGNGPGGETRGGA